MKPILLRIFAIYASAALLLGGCSDQELADDATPLACTTPPYATVIIEGKVTNAHGQPIAKATVTAKRLIADNLATVLEHTSTDAAGKYRIAQYITGSATLRMVCVSAIGTDSIDIVVNSSDRHEAPPAYVDSYPENLPSTSTNVDFVID